MTAGTTSDRMTRLLALIPYLTARPEGVTMAEVARDFGVTERQIQSDMELLWMCGLPGYGPGDLIDLAFEGDRVRVTFTAGMVRPLPPRASAAGGCEASRGSSLKTTSSSHQVQWPGSITCRCTCAGCALRGYAPGRIVSKA